MTSRKGVDGKRAVSQESGKILRFIIVGVINTLVGAAIMFGLYNLVGASYWVSSAANYILASILSFVLNKKFTFRHEGETVKSGLRFAVNIVVCYLVAYGIAKPCASVLIGAAGYGNGTDHIIQENAAMLIGMCLFVGLNYIGQRIFVFRDRKSC